MKQSILRNWKTIIAYTFLFLWGLLIYHPSLKLNFLLIDDGQIIKNSREIIDNFKTLNVHSILDVIIEPAEGRVRPAYWIIQTLITQLSFSSPLLMHALRLAILYLTCFMIDKVLKRFNIDLSWRFLVILLYITNFQNFENYYRLGPTESFLGLFFLIFVYQAFSTKISTINFFMTLLILLAGAFTKESFFLVAVPMFILLFFIKNRNIKYLKYNFIKFSIPLAIFGVFVLLLKNSYGQTTGYSLNYKFAIGDMLSRLNQYLIQINFTQFPFLIMAGIFIAYWLYKQGLNIFRIKSPKDLFILMLCGQIIIQLLILLPWVFVLGRYLLLVNICLTFIYGFALHDLWLIIENYLKKQHKYFSLNINNLRILFFLILIPTFLTRNIFPLANYQLWQKTDNSFTQSILESLNDKIPQNETIYNNYVKGDDNIEIYLETGWHLEEFFGRSDVNLSYLDDTNLCTEKERYIFDRTSVRYLTPDVFKQDIFTNIASGAATYSPLNYGEVKKSFIQGGRSVNWDQNYKFDWALYKQAKQTCIEVN